MTPQKMKESGMLSTADLTIITAGDHPTCKHSNGLSQIDYLLVDTTITSLISEVKLVEAKPWSTHAGIEFAINCRPATIHTLQQVKPKPIPYEKDDKGNQQQWHIADEEWQNSLEAARDTAEHLIDASHNDESGAWQHAEKLGITQQARTFAIRYAAWSIASEGGALTANPPEKDPRKHKGRGLMPKYEWRSLADKSKHKFTEHLMWELAAKDSIAGPDLYSTLWYTIASLFESAASARRLDDAAAQQQHPHRHQDCQHRV